MSQGQQSRVFGKRKKSHTIIFASGDKIRHVTLQPWVAGIAASFVGVMAIAYLAATSYLVLRDDLIGAAMARQARMQHSYEDRIAALRSQVDRVTSRQLLDQQLMEDKVAELLARQETLTSRQGRLGPLLERARAADAADTVPVPEKKPEQQAGNQIMEMPRSSRLAALASARSPVVNPAELRVNPLAYADPVESVGQRADRIFSKVTLSLKSIEREQVEKIQNLANNAYDTASQISEIMEAAGLPAPQVEASGIGGPYIRANDPSAFDASIDELDAALTQLDTVRESALSMPVSVPAPGAQITSRYGKRKDPFLGRLAFHSGIDFRTRTGTPVRASGSGTVVRAGRAGGYGNMVEIDHGHGLTTRYAHLSKILVKKGDRVVAGATIAKSGNSGRSTGPHLHYEIRRNGKAINPIGIIQAAYELRPLLTSN